VIKRDEVRDPASCLNKALDHELLFVLLGRDEDAPETIRYWVQRRILRGKNKPDDELMIEALATAVVMEQERERVRECARRVAALLAPKPEVAV
jgi:hypothetical protein